MKLILKKLFLPAFIITLLTSFYFGLHPEKINHFLLPALIFVTIITFSFNLNLKITRQNKLLKIVHIFILLIFICYAGFNVINVYSLSTNATILAICSRFAFFCNSIVSVFYTLKIYRFITLPPKFFIYLEFLFLSLLIVQNKKEIVRKFVISSLKKPIIFIASALVIITLSTQLLNTTEKIYEMSIRTWNNKNLSFLDRFVPYEFGIEHHGWIWEYGKFVSKHVPALSTIFIPPQNDIWAQEGNKYYFRWFVYPRTLVQSEDAFAKIPNEAEYIIISRGGWNAGQAGWPKKAIHPECIATAYLIDRYTLNERRIYPEEVSTGIKSTEWGIIELKDGLNIQCQ